MSTRHPKTVYLDNAATSFPKPVDVLRRMETCMEHKGGNPGRGTHALSMAAAEEVYRARVAAADLFGSSHPENVIFTLNTTHALNVAMKGLLRRGDHVLISDMEHNAVWRPIHGMAEAGIISYDVFDTYPTAEGRTTDMILSSIVSRMTAKTRMIICAHASNICSAVLPIEAIGAFCRRHGILFVVDGAQSAGVYPIHMERMGIDALCLPGHKGLMGPQGVGILLLGQGISPTTLMEGGNGVDSLKSGMGDSFPERYEAGTPPTPAIAGLRGGLSYVDRVGLDRIRAVETEVCAAAKAGLLTIPGIKVYAPHHQGSVLLFSVRGHTSEEIGAYLDSRGICVRAGFHCAALAHRTLGTPSDGAVRASFGYFNTERDAEALVKAMRAVAT